MYQTNLTKRSLRSALLLGAASAAAISLSLPASAQESTETVVVTGSRIPQAGLYSASPVTAVGQQEMKFEGTQNVETLLNNLPSVFADQTSGVSNGATGTATVNLRNLGAARTLVLVNGTRLMPGDPHDPVADLNQVPAALVDHVEVLTGGASAVYGSDALAGVVNFVMRKDFEGVELDGQYGISEADNSNGYYRGLVAAEGFQQAKEGILDGASDTGTLIIGANTDNGKGNVTAYVGYENTEAVLAGARDFSACTIGGTSAHHCAGSSNYNRWISLDDYYAGKPYDFFETGTGKKGSGAFTPWTGAPSQHFNYGALNYLQRPDTRYTGGFFAHYEVNKELDVYSSFMFTDDHTLAQIAPSGLFLGTGADGGLVQVNCTNPLMTAQEAAALCGNGTITPGQALLEIGRRDIEGGDRVDDLRHTAYRAQIGARGDLGDGWSYDVYAQYGLSLFTETYDNEFSVSRVQNALEVDPKTGKCYVAEPNAEGQVIDPKCVPLDIFDGIGSITPAMLNYIGAQGFQEGYTEEQIISGSLTGDLGEYGLQSPWAKSPVAVSVGSEYRAEYLELQTDREFQTNDLYGQGAATLPVPRSGFNVKEGFGELKIPLVQEKPWVEDLSFNAGYRYSSYSQSGSVSSYKYGVEYQPVDDFRLRASYERAVRAPNVLESFSPQNVDLFTGQDPCATSTAGQCASVRGAGTALLNCPAGQCDQLVGGNPNLRPEISDTRTIGGVFTPTFLDGFTLTVDYWDINVSQFIGTVSPDVTLSECYGPAATAGTEAFFCPLVHRNALGQIYGAGYVSALNLNTGYLKENGIDVEANYQVNLDDWNWTAGNGSLSAAFVGTYLHNYVTEPLPGLGNYDCAGLFGTTCGVPNPHWRHRLRLTWSTPWDVDFSVNWRYISAVELDLDTKNPLLISQPFDIADRSINNVNYFDFAADWNVRTGVDLHFGVNNVADKLPPTLTTRALPADTGNDNTFPGTYDSLGRTFFVGATLKY